MNRKVEEVTATIRENSKTFDNVDRVQMTTGDRKAELLKAVGDARADIDDFRVYEPSLNDIFVKYTEGGV